MKKIKIFAIAAFVICGLAGCTKEKMDTFVEWGFAKDTNSEITTKNARKTADKANAMIDAGHVCPADYIFVVRIKYDSDRYETVWSHDYRGN